MLDEWDDLIAQTNANSSIAKPEVKETKPIKNKDFSFGNALEEATEKRVSGLLGHVSLDPLKLPPITKKKPKDETSGPGWFNMPKSKLTEEDKRDWQLLHMRSVLEKGASNVAQLPEEPPEYVQFGTVITHATDGQKARLSRKQRAPTLAESLAKDDNFISYLNDARKKLSSREKAFNK